MHIIHINGNVGRDGELKTTQKGTAVLSFPLASKDRGDTTWFDCAIFGERANKLAPHITKGTGLSICGVPGLRVFKKKDGEPGGAIQVNVDKLDFTGGGQAQEKPAQQPTQPGPIEDEIMF